MQNRIAILGAGESGIGAALLAARKGYAVWVSDAGKIREDRKSSLSAAGITFEEGKHSEEEILSAGEIIKSPGIPDKAEIVTKARAKGISVIDELEFAYRYSKGKVIAITGTNGKTTTTLLTYHLMKKGGKDVGLAGNVGESWAAQLVNGDKSWWVLETSSFQIDGFKSFKPEIAILTNISPDHLDRYDYQVDNYIASKMSLFKNMDAAQIGIFSSEDPLTQQGLENYPNATSRYQISFAKPQTKGGYYDGMNISLSVPGKKISISKNEIKLKGKHNMANSIMAALAALLSGVDEASIREGLSDFENASHRMQHVATIAGVDYINDSKGTNVEATLQALDSYEQPVIWIAGGVDKGNNYNQLYRSIGSVKALVCMGKDNSKLIAAFGEKVKTVVETQSMEAAIREAKSLAVEGDVVLLSPACASFDLFKNYEDRGNQFIKMVENLKYQKL